MNQKIVYVALVVDDYDKAIAYYTEKLNFRLIEDTLQENKRWVLMAPPGSNECSIVLAKAKNAEEVSRIGNQTGGRVFLFLHTDDFWRDYSAMKANGICFVRMPKEESYGTVAVFEDLYGNRWDLLELKDKRLNRAD